MIQAFITREPNLVAIAALRIPYQPVFPCSLIEVLLLYGAFMDQSTQRLNIIAFYHTVQ